MAKNKKYFWKSLNTKLGHSPHRIKNETIKGIRQLAYLKIVAGKTLGKLPWKSKVQLQRNGMAAIPKIPILLTRKKIEKVNYLKTRMQIL